MARVRLNPNLARDFPRSASGRRTFRNIGDELLDDYRDKLAESTAGPALGSMAGSYSRDTDTGVAVGTTAPDANIVEFGTSQRTARSPLRRAADAFGRFRPN